MARPNDMPVYRKARDKARMQGGVCALCGKVVHSLASRKSLGMRSHKSKASIDHIVPTSKGGANDPSNFRLVHMGCNARRGGGSGRRGRRPRHRMVRNRKWS